MKLQHEPSLDGVRALAALAVLFGHAQTPWLLGGGGRGVDVFFVLSGYLITGILMRQDRIDLREFWLRRVRRLVPALLAMVAGVLALSFVYAPGVAPTWIEVAETVTYTYNFGVAFGQRFSPLSHTWSLAAEMQFYLLWPLLLPWLLKRRDPLFWVGLFYVGETLLRVCVTHYDPRMAACLPLTRTTGLALGAWLALGGAVPNRLGWLGLALIAGSMLAAFPGQADNLAEVAAELGAALLIRHLAAGPSVLRSALSARPLADLGLISYGIYLWHVPLMSLLGGTPWWIKAPLVAWASVVLAATSYCTVERWARPRRSGSAHISVVARAAR